MLEQVLPEPGHKLVTLVNYVANCSLRENNLICLISFGP